jgi:hypothetical protein
MKLWHDEFEEFDEQPEEIPDEFVKEKDPESIDLIEMNTPDLWWAEPIKGIENPEIKQKENEAAKKIIEKQDTLNEKLDSGEISKSEFDHEHLVKLGREKAKLSTRSDLESVGLSYDHLADISEDMSFIFAGEVDLIEKTGRIEKMIELQGPEASQELADEMLADGRISKNAHDLISRKVRLSEK